MSDASEKFADIVEAHLAGRPDADELRRRASGVIRERKRTTPLIVCPRCGPEFVSYAGRVEWRLCGDCRRETEELDRVR